MAEIIDTHYPRILYSRISKKTMEGELFIKQHSFDYIISGTSTVFFNNKKTTFKAGDLRFAIRNRLSRFIKTPPENGEYRSVSICVDQSTLVDIAKQNQYIKSIKNSQEYENLISLRFHKRFENYIDTLIPYLEEGAASKQLIEVKVKEAVLIFMGSNPELKDILFDFSEPGKIDLEAYMNQHYAYNGELNDFAYLTGRSLSTFRRDFKKIFKTTPNRWLINKRLENAHYLLKEKGMKPNEVFIDAGFKDYSHFSVKFKEKFGIPPSLLNM
ncbi:helix-turn-helix domain-containing protein [Mesoflavibacter zeaxanthinifaciens]|uniref:helix-turn-helix domain-containing protein n=1 Tax=Mesoflavibacter zeaxanthinifaciens TaxID=393060 RepID=UPI003A928364